MQWFFVALLFWVGFGAEMLCQEVIANNKKLLEGNFWHQLKIFGLCVLYGPYARKKVISKL